MKYVYMVKFDWSTTDLEDIEIYIYENYDSAYSKFKELAQNEYNPEKSWIGELEFDEDGYPLDENYELNYEDNNSGESEVYWHFVDKNDYYKHSFIDLIRKELLQ